MRRINLKDIVPDLEGRLKKLNTLRKVFMVLALLIIPAIPAMIVLAKYGACMQLCHAVQAVKLKGKMPIFMLFAFASNEREAAQKLIDTGNLAGYRIVGDVMIVRDDIEMTDEEAWEEAAPYFNAAAAINMGMTADNMPECYKKIIEIQQRKEKELAEGTAEYGQCPSCGAPVKSADSEFCDKCGTRL